MNSALNKKVGCAFYILFIKEKAICISQILYAVEDK